MKVKKIITAASCAALIAAAALPLTACGGAKKLETTENLSLDSYAASYESKYNKNLAAPTRANIGVCDFESFYNNNNYFYVSTRIDPNEGYVSTYYTKNCNYIVSTEGQYSDIDVDGRFISYIVSTRDEDEDIVITKSLHGEDGNLLVYDAYVGSDFDISEVEFYENSDEEKSKFICVDYMNNDHERKQAYFRYDEDENGRRNYNNTPVDVSAFKSYSSEFDVGNNVFGAEVKLANYYDNVWQGSVAEYSVQRAGNEMVFRNGGEETGRVNMDGVNNFVFADESMYYTKLVALPEGDKNANVIKSIRYGDAYYTYELHRYSITNNKDKKLPNYGIVIDEMAPLYNRNNHCYDAIAISGAKLDGKKYQSGSKFQYILDKDFKLSFDATGLASFTDATHPAQIVRGITTGDYFVLSQEFDSSGGWNEVLTPVDGRLARTISSKLLAKDYYANENMFRVRSEETRAYGFVDLGGNVIASPVYVSADYGDNIQFYGDRAYVYNTVKDEYVFLNKNGTETSAPRDYTTVYDGWYYEESFDETKTLELFSFDGTKIISYDNVDQYSSVFGNQRLMKISFTEGAYQNIILNIV